jgi:stalled ribosome rescue protein Dom34
VIIANPSRTKYADEFIFHIKNHQSWLNQRNNKVSFSKIIGSVSTKEKVKILIRKNEFKKLISKTTIEETDNLIAILEKSLVSSKSKAKILFSFDEISNIIQNKKKYIKFKPDYLLLTDGYLEFCKHKNRINRLLQLAKNKNIKIRVVSSELPAGKRLTQLGGLVLFSQSKRL